MVMFPKFILICFSVYCIINTAEGQDCRPHSGLSLEKMAVSSHIVIQATPKKITGKVGKGSHQMYNITAKVASTFATHNGGFKKGDKIEFGPVGKSSDCQEVKPGKTKYLLFLQKPNDNDILWVQYNPIRKVKRRDLRKIGKLLCKNCLQAPKFKQSEKTYKKQVGDKITIKCKVSGKPKPGVSWYHNGKLLDKHNTPKGFRVKIRKRGGGGTIKIKKLEVKHNNNIFTCSAQNVASDVIANYTVTLVVKVPIRCDQCSKVNADLCGNHGNCCLGSDKIPYCECYESYKGTRCDEKAYRESIDIKVEDEFRHRQRVIAVLGMCLALFGVLFLCMAVYCLFKLKRLKSSPPFVQIDGRTYTRKTSNYEFTPGKNRPGLSFESNQYNAPSLQSFNAVNQIHKAGTSSDISSAGAVLDEPVQPSLATRKKIYPRNLNGYNNVRPRLNGTAKNVRSGSGMHPAPFGQQENVSHQISTSEHEITSMQVNVRPEERTSVKKRSIAVSRATPDNHYEKIYLSEIHSYHCQTWDGKLPQSHVVTTFPPNGDIKQENVDVGSCSHDLAESSLCTDMHCSSTDDSSQMTNQHANLPHTLQNVPSVSEDSRRDFRITSSSEHTHNCQDYVVPRGNRSPTSTDDHDDPFRGVEIPDTSLCFCNSSPCEHDTLQVHLPQKNSTTVPNILYV
ncbi:unnamed protein product [Clavelina lepadiformis]|uniref:Ig-like domain-containing protein n=1 Tax=Clavelina lepadiformis TaxID=159417 RepID=A0ABP0H1F3_CLALP